MMGWRREKFRFDYFYYSTRMFYPPESSARRLGAFYDEDATPASSEAAI
jgi:hypothetical protein